MKLLEYEMSNVTLLWFLKETVFEETRAEAGCFCERKSAPLSSAPLKKFLPEKRLMCSKKVSQLNGGFHQIFVDFF